MTGEELRQLRTRLGLTQEQLAVELGVSQETVSRWEQGKRRISRLAEVAIEAVAARHV